ncbi:UNVERIFIED_CONTAM: protein ZINC INDUCED FACILITATOR-LIKE 1, partial [Sesamum latifolium]
AYACETVRDEYQSLGLSAVSTAWGAGLIIGPALGGFLAQPAEKFPGIFASDSFLARFPYFLPCLIISLFAAVVTVACFWIPETLHTHNSEKIASQDSYDALESANQGSNEKEEIEEGQETTSKESLFRNWPLMSSIIVYCVFSLHDMAYTEIFSLWAESPRRLGGLSYTTEDVGMVLVISDHFNSSVNQLSLHSYAIWHHTVHSAQLCISPEKRVFYFLNTGPTPEGAANGIAMLFMSLFKAAGPAGGGTLFSWAQKRQHADFLPGTISLSLLQVAVMPCCIIST